MRKKLRYSCLLPLLLGFAACDDVNLGNLFCSPCDVNTRFEQSMAYNQANPLDTLHIDNANYAFWVSSDLHIEESESPYVNQFLKTANDGRCQFIVYNGDLYHGKEAYADYASNLLHTQSPLPAFYVAGNHDLYFGWNIYQERFGTSTYTAVVATPSGNDLLIFLESASATLGKDQYAWLKETLTKRGYYRHCFVFTHTNLIYQHITNGVFMSDEAQLLFRLFSDHKVSAVFTGHSHVANKATVMGVPYLNTGSLKNGEVLRMHIEEKQILEEFKSL